MCMLSELGSLWIPIQEGVGITFRNRVLTILLLLLLIEFSHFIDRDGSMIPMKKSANCEGCKRDSDPATDPTTDPGYRSWEHFSYLFAAPTHMSDDRLDIFVVGLRCLPFVYRLFTV